MNILAVNGSPRKNWNTATLLGKALEGAASQGAATELVHLYDLNFKGCVSCFACKVKGGKSYGHCAHQDDLSPLLQKTAAADAIILGSPIYFGNLTGEMRSFLERLLFQYVLYDASYTSLFPKKIPVGFIYTMNVDKSRLQEINYDQNLRQMEFALAKTIGSCETLFAYDTYQFSDYAKYEVTAFSEPAKASQRQHQFPLDCQKAFEMGVKFAALNGAAEKQ